MDDGTTTDVTATTDEIEGQPAHRTVVWLLIILGTVVMVLSTLNAWVERQLLDTDSWVNASTQLLDNDDVRREVSVRLVNALHENVDVGTAIDEQLPEQLQGLGGPLAGVLRDPLIDATETLLNSPPLRAVWKDANRATHGAVLAILEDDVADNISTSDGKVVIDLGGVLVQVGEQIGLPQDVLDAIPDEAGQFQLVESDELESAQSAVTMIRVLSIVYFLLVLALYCGAVYLARNWRRTAIRNVGLATALGGFTVLIAVRLGVTVIAGTPDTPGGRSAAEAILAIGTSLLRRSAWSEIIIGLLIALVASLVGPARYAKRVQYYTARSFRRAPVGTWVGLAVLALVFLTWSPFSAGGDWLTVLIVLVLVAIGIEALRRTSLADDTMALGDEASTPQAGPDMADAGQQR